MAQRNYPEMLQMAAKQNVKERDYWLQQLSGELIKSSFPGAYNDKSREEFIMNSLAFHFLETQENELYTRLMELSKGSNYSLNLVLISAITLLLGKYTGREDIILATPIHRQPVEKDFVNTILVLRNRIAADMTFKEFLLQVRQTIKEANENQNYPIEILMEELRDNTNSDYPFDVIVLLENIHEKKYIQDVKCNTLFSFLKEENCINGVLEYNSALYTKLDAEQIITHFIHLLSRVLTNVELPLGHLEIITEKERKQILVDFNNTGKEYPGDKTAGQLFEAQAIRTPDKVAVCAPIEINDIFQGSSCFKMNPYVFQSDLEYLMDFKLLKTHHHNCIVVNRNTLKLLERFDGQESIESIFLHLKSIPNIKFIIYNVEIGDMLEITHGFDRKPAIFSNMEFADFISLVKLLAESHLIELSSVRSAKIRAEKINSDDFASGEPADNKTLKDLFFHNITLTQADILLLGDTPGMPSTGLLYIASYLRRNGINVLCRFYDRAIDYQSMKTDIESLLQQIHPRIVGISLKWFLYIAHVLDMGKIIKEYAAKNNIAIKVVLGGNTASYYWKEIIKYDYIDCIIRGDGELPLLQICRDKNFADIPNCIYKSGGEIKQTPFTYIKDESNSPGIYLSHLAEIMFPLHTVSLGTFFIYTHLGCGRNCIYCGGCNHAQEETFNRKTFFIRPAKEVRKDIIEIMPYVSTLQFDFDTAPGDVLEYCREIWRDLPLSGYFCIISRLRIPSAPLIELAIKTFKYVYWDIDVLTLSERHREQLVSLALVKAQPLNAETLYFLQRCNAYKNTEVRFNLIAGLPYLTREDIDTGDKFLDGIMSEYPVFKELHWARLHAQPGAPITTNAKKYNMHSFAVTFEDFLAYSEKNLPRASLEHLNYPYVYFNDDALNSKITFNYTETNKKIQQYNDKKQQTCRFHCETLTYSQLDKKANQLAGVLRERGIIPGSIIGIMLNPSINIPLAILAAWKAGAAYLPIDPEYPKERINYILKDSGAKLLVIANDQEGEKVRSWEGEKVFLASANHLFYQHSALCIPHSNHLAYVIYTSGTTGKPKGVMIEHQNLVNYIDWFSRTAHITGEDKSILTSSFAFDLGYTSLYPPLSVGGESHILSKDMYMSPPKLIDYIHMKGITYVKMTPSLLWPIIDSPEFNAINCRSLRLIVIGGETIKPDTVEKARQICPHLEIINHYGPTETTIGCIACYIDFQQFEKYRINPIIGKPISNVAAIILDRDINLLPIGVPGELYLAGAGLGRGYLNNPGLTVERFLRHYRSYRTYRTYILYKTGDLARWMPDGNIEFLGRIDNQVKIRGFRIEPQEIEIELLKLDMIKECAVIVREDRKKNKYLCAYVVSIFTGEIEKEAKNYLSTKLPDYMVPAFFVRLEKIPLTPNGKIDRHMLPEPGLEIPVRAEEEQLDEIEEKLAGLWVDLLGIEKEKIRKNSNFFELGGNSIQLIALIAKIHEVFEVEISINQFFDNPVLNITVELIKSKKYAEVPVVLLNRLHEKKIFCFPPQVAYSICYNGLADLINDYSWYAFNFIEDIDYQEIIRNYARYIMNFQPKGPYILYGYSAAGKLIFQVTRALEDLGLEVSDIIFWDCFFTNTENEIRREEQLVTGEFIQLIEKFLGFYNAAFLKEKAINKSGKYMKYILNTNSLEKINANVHLIVSESFQNSENPHPGRWDNFTNGNSVIYRGFGLHHEMLNMGIIEKNIQITKEILEKIESRPKKGRTNE